MLSARAARARGRISLLIESTRHNKNNKKMLSARDTIKTINKMLSARAAGARAAGLA